MWRPCLDPFLTFYERVLGLWVFSFDESTEISARFHRKVLRKDFFTKITFRKNVLADFYDIQTMRDKPSHPLDPSSIGSRIRSRNKNERESLRYVYSFTPSIDMMAEVDSPKLVNITEAESSPPITRMEGSLQIRLVSVIGVEKVEGWREKYNIPSLVAIQIPGPFDIASDFLSDEIAVYEGFFELVLGI
ncbi:hypothetical protein F2Q68_00039809 [Brassica cretica]|uniref:Uncharacterized protein n=1 Tax=Brassica cretica TaxID=69181 RepID=A0A8S9MPE6_BRACR|nr:hypothetical protein F2Q68_00039809 [Brassica cretica]